MQSLVRAPLLTSVDDQRIIRCLDIGDRRSFIRGLAYAASSEASLCECTVKTVLNGHSERDKIKILMTVRLMKIESIAECSHWGILLYF